MGSRFFTWTKGDKRNASEALRSAGIVPIPVECLSVQGLDYGRTAKASSKAHRKPLPLSFEKNPDATSKHSATDNSIALHDATVQSATSLMAVMNDMLRSPHLSAHLQQRSAGSGLQPMHGRPRSHTAPSTPWVEAPLVEPVELPGSLLVGQKSSTSLHHLVDGKSFPPTVQSPNDIIGRSIERPHTSPHVKGYALPAYSRKSSDSLLRTGALQPPPPLSPSSKSYSPRRNTAIASAGVNSADGEDTLMGHDSDTNWASMKRPSLSMLRAWPPKSQGFAPSQGSSQAGSTTTLSQYAVPKVVGSSSHVEILQHPDAESTLIEQITTLRASHDEHINSLREAHEKEIASHRAYIAFLEKRKGFPAVQAVEPKQHLTIDTSQMIGRSGELMSADVSATTLQSFESSLETQKRASQESATEAESLKRKLSLYRKAQAESLEIRRERDQLRQSADRSDRRILQLKDIVRKAKENESTLKNAVENLEARLFTANNERTDVLEGFHDACEKMRKLAKREQSLTRDLDDARGKLFYSNASYTSVLTTTSDPAHEKSKHSRPKSGLSLNAWNSDPLLGQVRDLRRLIAEKDTRIQHLEQQLSLLESHAAKESCSNDFSRQVAKVNELEATFAEQKELLDSVQADRDRFNSLLHNELRRQTRYAAQKAHTATPRIEAEASAAVGAIITLTRSKIAKAAACGMDIPSAEATSASLSPLFLEKELQHCLKEIIMYKLDIKGYKKDLKRANAELESLRALNVKPPPTPDRDSTSSAKSGYSNQTTGQYRSGHGFAGLGISLNAPPKTPTRIAREATSAALLSALSPAPDIVSSIPPRPYKPNLTIREAYSVALTPTPRAPESASAPPPRLKTPLGNHKRLPKPPVSQTPSPMLGATPPVQALQQGETLRSLSESIISSYASRTTAEQGAADTSRQTGRSSAPTATLSTPGIVSATT